MTNWDDWQYYLGEWIGEGTGEPGEGVGGFRFDFDLQGQILIRRNFAEYPPSAEKAAYRHDDLMIIYRETEGTFRAMYWDNEGHVIHYTVEFSKDKNTLTFIGDVQPSAPRFRFTYQKRGAIHCAFSLRLRRRANLRISRLTLKRPRKERLKCRYAWGGNHGHTCCIIKWKY